MSSDALARRKKTRPGVELLESRALLSVLSASLTTDQTVYQVGQPIQMTFTETNTSDQPINVDEGPSIDGFDVTHNGASVWESNWGINPMVLVAQTLAPGQSLTLKATWNGSPSPGLFSGMPVGTFTVTNQLDPQAASATFQIGPSTPSPTPPTPSLVSASVATKQRATHDGQTVLITLTLTNTSGQSVTISPNSTSDGFRVLSDSTQVWHSSRSPRIARSRTLAPGETITFQAVWNSKAHPRGENTLARGPYTVVASMAGYSAATTIQIDS